MANNLLVDWLNKKPKATLKNAQTVVNNNTASNMQNITTPTINAGSVAGVQQVNKPTLQVSAPLTTTNVKSSIQSNNPAFNNGALVTAQNQPSRFIGFQQQPQVANTVLDRTPNEKQGLSWNRLVNGGYNYVPSEVSKAETSNRAEENRYRTMSEAFYDLQGTLYNKGKVLGENELRQKFPEFKDLDINILNELQNELLPIVSSGKGVDADQISQIYPELLKGKELKDINTVKEKVQKGNDRYKGWEKAIQKVAKGDVEGMSSEGVQSVQDAKAIWQAVQAVKKDGVIGGGTDYEILRELYQRDPEIKRLMDDFNSRELTEKDKIIWGREDANKIGQLFRGATDWLRKDDEFMKSDEELESLKNKAEAMENDYWGQVAGTAKVGLRTSADAFEKFIYRLGKDAKLWTIEDIDEYLDQSERNEMDVREYNKLVDTETENIAQRSINPDVRNYYNNHTMSRSIALGDVPGFFLQSTKSAAENIDMPIIIAAGVVAPEVVLPLMATDTYVRESEDAFETLLENGANYDDAEQGAVIVGVASTAVELYLEKLLGGVETTASRTIRDALMKDISKKTTEMVAERGLVDLAKRGLTTQLRSSMEEGLEEIVQQSIQNYAVSKYNPDVKITDGLREAFEGGFFNPMNLLAGGGEIASNVDVNALNQGAYNAGVRTREIVDNTKNSLNRGAYNAGAFLGNMTEDFKNNVTSQGRTDISTNQQQAEGVNTTSENQNNINGDNYNQKNKNSKSLNQAQLGLLKSYNKMNPVKITEFQDKFGKDYGQAMADMGYTESRETNVPKMEEDIKEIYNEKKKAMNSVEGEFQDRSLRDMLNIMLKKAKNTLDYDMIDKYEKLKQKHNTKGLTMAEANDMREEFSYKIKTKWGGDGNSDKIDLADNVYTAVRKFLETTAEKNGIKDLQKMNRDIAMRKYLSTRIGDKAERQSANNMMSINDWIMFAEAATNPQAMALFAGKKVLEQTPVKNAVLNAVVGRRQNRAIDQQNRQAANKERMENIESANRGKELQQELTPSKTPALPNGIKLTKVTEIDNRKPKNKVTKKNNNKKSDSSSSDDTTPPTGGTPTNNQGGTPATDDTKNVVTKKKSETKKQVKNAITNQKSGLTADENAKLREGISILQEVKQEVNDSNFEGIVDIVNRLGEEKTKQVIKDMNDLRRKLENISERQAELGKDTRADRSVLHDLRGQILFLEYALNEKSNIGKTADGLDKVANHSRPSKTLRGLIADEIEKYKYQDNDARIDMSIKTIRDEKLVRGALYGYMTDALAPTNRAAELGGNILRKVGIDPTEYEQEASNAPTHYTDGKANEYKTPEERAKNKVTAKKKAEATTTQEENSSDLKNLVGERFYNYLKRQVEIINESRKGIREPITIDDLDLSTSSYAIAFERIASEEFKEARDKLDGLNIAGDTSLTPEQQKQLKAAKTAAAREKLLEKWRAEYLANHGLTDEQIEQIEAVMQEIHGIVEQHKRTREYLLKLSQEKADMQTRREYEDRAVVDMYNEEQAPINALISLYEEMNVGDEALESLFGEIEAEERFMNALNENQTPQDIDYQELAEMENETPQANEEEMNKVTRKQAEKPKNLVTSKSKVDQILEKANGTELKVKIGNDEDSYLVVFNADGKDQAYTVTEEQLKELNDKGANFENVDERAERQAKIDKEVEQNIKAFERTEEKPKDLVTNPKKAETTTSKGEIQEIDKDTYFDDIVKNLKDHPREMFIYKDGSYFYPHYILPSGKVLTPENTYWGEVSSEEAARNWLLKEAEEHSEENETKKAEKLKEIVGKTAEKYEATLKRIESDNPMQEIWASGDYFKYGTSNSQMAKAKKESEANAEVGTFKKDVIDGKEGYRIFVAGTKNEAIRAFYEPRTGKTYRIYRGPVIDDSKPYTTKQVERIEKFLQNVEKQLDKETKREKPQEKTYITQEWLDGLKPDNDGVIELDSKGNESFALRKGKETLIKEGKADGKYIENYGGERSPQYLAFYIKDGVVYEGRKGLEDQYMKTKQEAVDWLNQKEKDVEHEATERYTQTDYETLPKTISVESEAEKAGPKRIAPDRVKRQQETYNQGLESVKNVLKQSPFRLYDLGFKSDRSKAVQDIMAERQRIKQLPESEADKQWTELAKSVYEDLVIKDISKGYRYPEDVTSKFPKAQMKKAVDARARYEKGLFTSFSAKDTRANNQYRDEIGAGIKSQDGKPVTQEQMNEIVDGIRSFGSVFGLNMKKFAEDNNIIYVHLHGGNPFLMGGGGKARGGGMNIAGLYRKGADGNISISLGGVELVMEKGEDGEMKKNNVNATPEHELAHAVDYMLENKLFSSQDIEILKKTMNKPTRLINYYNRSQEIVARAVEQYAANKTGKSRYGKPYVSSQAYWDQENFDKYVKPIVEKNMKEKMKDYLIQQPKKNVLSNDKNKITSK